MKKIISLFCRNYDGNRQVRDEVVPGAEWVTAGDGQATRKFDGAACMVSFATKGRLHRRYDVKLGRTPPNGWIPCEPDRDANTGHWPGWLPVGEGPEDKWFLAALHNTGEGALSGTYEACGPHFQGNPERFPADCLVRHGRDVLPDVPRTFDGLREYFGNNDIEGIVWHHTDGRMVKIKAKDFGVKRGAR